MLQDIYKELDLLKEYMNIYVQLLPYCIECGGMRLHKSQRPTFEEYKKYRDSFVIPEFKDEVVEYDGHTWISHCKGLKMQQGLQYRYYNYYMGCKYYTGDNVEGRWTISDKIIKHLFNYNQF